MLMLMLANFRVRPEQTLAQKLSLVDQKSPVGMDCFSSYRCSAGKKHIAKWL